MSNNGVSITQIRPSVNTDKQQNHFKNNKKQQQKRLEVSLDL